VSPETGARVARLFEAKARAELAAADAVLGAKPAVANSGDALGSTVLVKGAPDAGDRAARRALAGPDGVAATKALAALGLDADAVLAVCSRPAAGDADAHARRLELVVEAVDPRLVIALDAAAAEDLAAAFRVPALVPGRPVMARGRVLGAVGDLAASLGDPNEKARVWARFKSVAAGMQGPGGR